MSSTSVVSNQKFAIFWFRRDLRLEDNTALNEALKIGLPVKPIFIFDTQITSELPKDDARISFIYSQLANIQLELEKHGSSLTIYHGDPLKIWEEIAASENVSSVFFNKDYEPYAIKRDSQVQEFLSHHNVTCNRFKDHVIFEENEVVKKDGKPYTIYTPFKNKWLEKLDEVIFTKELNTKNLHQYSAPFPSLQDIGFIESKIKVPEFSLSQAHDYAQIRDFPSKNGTSLLAPHLRFGTVSIRDMVIRAKEKSDVFLSELIWREFFMQILWHFPEVQNHNFKRKYDGVEWRNNPAEFEQWCKGETGYPMVDAGMRELLATGHMHNRVRMIVAGFLCKHLLIDWKWGEAFFAKHLLDYELASNNGNWQWAAGTGCDSAPYFRIFNPTEQLKKFDKDLIYIHKWIPEYNMGLYLPPMVDHKMARLRALDVYKKGIIQ